MRNLGAVEAANEIRHDISNLLDQDPEDQHAVRFIQGVCSHLGLDHSPGNMHKVAVCLHKHDIETHRGQEFPKFAIRDYDKAQKIVHDEQEEKEWVEASRPEPVLPLGPVVNEPESELDLTKQVPDDGHTITGGDGVEFVDQTKSEPAKDEPAKDEPAKDEPAKDEPAPKSNKSGKASRPM